MSVLQIFGGCRCGFIVPWSWKRSVPHSSGENCLMTQAL